MTKFYLVPAKPVTFDDEAALAAYFTDKMHARDMETWTIVKGVALQPKMQLSLLPVGVTAKAPRPARVLPEPAEGVRAAVLDFFQVGIVASKRKFTAETGMATDTASAAIDYLTQHGTLALKGKSYERAPVAKEPA